MAADMGVGVGGCWQGRAGQGGMRACVREVALLRQRRPWRPPQRLRRGVGMGGKQCVYVCV